MVERKADQKAVPKVEQMALRRADPSAIYLVAQSAVPRAQR